jgi:2,3-bisphosphoglycerate-dependent phosphoglycerate mutase
MNIAWLLNDDIEILLACTYERGIIMTKVYFVRHAKPDFSIKDDLIRPLTEEGLNDSKKVTEFLSEKEITKVFSSPYKRAVDTIKDFAECTGLPINIIEDFRERKVDDVWIEDFNSFAREQWNNFKYKLSNGESLHQVQKRNIAALLQVLKENEGENIVIGTHGTALSTMINYFDKGYGYKEFERIKNIMPYIVCMVFEEVELKEIKEFII